MMKAKYLIFLPIAHFLVGCGTAWVVSQKPDSGIIGYKGFSSGEKAQKEISKLIPCPNWTMVSDDMRSRDFQYTTTQTVTTQSSGAVYAPSGVYNYSGNQTHQVPVTQTGTDVWRELTYSCDSNSSRNLSGQSLDTNSPNGCTEACYKKFVGKTDQVNACYATCEKPH